MLRYLALLALGGCDHVLGLERNIDALDAVGIDAPGPCIDPRFDAYTFAQRTYNFGAQSEPLVHPAVGTSLVYVATVGGRLIVSTVEGMTASNLLLETDHIHLSPSFSHDYATLFYERRLKSDTLPLEVVRWNVGDDPLTRSVVTFEIGGTIKPVTPSSVGRYRDGYRMVVVARLAGGMLRLHEVVSRDLTTWTEVAGTLPWALPTGLEFDATLSADGCTLVFASTRDGDLAIHYAWRNDDAEGTFGTPRALPGNDPVLFERSPAIAPDGRLYYFRGTDFNQTGQELIVGTPPP